MAVVAMDVSRNSVSWTQQSTGEWGAVRLLSPSQPFFAIRSFPCDSFLPISSLPCLFLFCALLAAVRRGVNTPIQGWRFASARVAVRFRIHSSQTDAVFRLTTACASRGSRANTHDLHGIWQFVVQGSAGHHRCWTRT